MTPDWQKEYQEYLDSLKHDLSDYLLLIQYRATHEEITVDKLIEWGEMAKQKQDAIKLQENLFNKLKRKYEEQNG